MIFHKKIWACRDAFDDAMDNADGDAMLEANEKMNADYGETLNGAAEAAGDAFAELSGMP